eukprot:CAMPEP_0184647048 /NCGR_PEP_ID=MMETSP0308-20130426/3934_1 /TAXON_ID=38269 /ORGANISM="Gloeochaete witrockiana, Strain SAG 46.84" /LENGTH=678 /DNA_ID=CAMNT_0027077713 /DNA_START=27 /DNA_END=2063 /DNA_ORIENTATION=-
MATNGVSEVDALQAAVTKQASYVKSLKAENADKAQIDAAVEKLKTLKGDFEQKVKERNRQSADTGLKDRRSALEAVLKGRYFIAPAFEIYGGVGGLYDFGPPGCAIKANLLALWRQHFILEEGMLEIDCTNLTPEIVLKTSGHVEKFNDLMVRDVVTKDCYRADKLLEERTTQLIDDPTTSDADKEKFDRIRAQAGSYSQDELAEKLREFKIKAPDTGNDLSDPFPFNLMFQTSIGPSGTAPGYLRPETAQGMFVNFKRLLEYNGGRVPFAAAQIGIGFRNEIAPRSGLIRVREFCLAEIEHFVNPNNKNHARFSEIASLEMQLFPRNSQLETGQTIKKSLGNAVKEGMINNETLAYFMGRTYLFLVKAGIRPEYLRFRQHLSTEMAHYASDCWDAEIFMSYGWVECVGHADRACFDLRVHSEKSKVDLVAYEEFSEAKIVTVFEAVPNRGLLGSAFRHDSKKIVDHLASLDESAIRLLQASLEAHKSSVITLSTGETFTLKPEFVSFRQTTKKLSGQNYLPGVIEPAFGIGRIIYGILEHSFDVRKDDEQRNFFHFPPIVAPYKVTVLPLMVKQELDPFTQRLYKAFLSAGISARVDKSSAAIGRRYARADEVGVPFACTIDYDGLPDETCTLRDRDSTQQIRAKLDDMPALVKSIIEDSTPWSAIYSKYPHVIPKE